VILLSIHLSAARSIHQEANATISPGPQVPVLHHSSFRHQTRTPYSFPNLRFSRPLQPSCFASSLNASGAQIHTVNVKLVVTTVASWGAVASRDIRLPCSSTHHSYSVMLCLRLGLVHCLQIHLTLMLSMVLIPTTIQDLPLLDASLPLISRLRPDPPHSPSAILSP
jgi:hypothetical protein